MRLTVPQAAATFALAAFAATGCSNDEQGQGSPPERADRAPQPPPGWRTVRDRRAGFTVAAPRSWSARTGKTTVIRSGDGLVSVTLAADRSGAGRQKSAGTYGREILDALPGFQGSVEPGIGRVAGSPYRTAVIRATGTVGASPGPQRITVAVLQRPGRVTYTAVAFLAPPAGDQVVLRLLGTFRARPSATQAADQRSGRSGYRSSIVVSAR